MSKGLPYSLEDLYARIAELEKSSGAEVETRLTTIDEFLADLRSESNDLQARVTALEAK